MCAYAHKAGLRMCVHTSICCCCTPLNTRWILYFCYGSALGFLLVQCGILLFYELAFHSLSLTPPLSLLLFLSDCVCVHTNAHAHNSFSVFVSFFVLFSKKLCIRPLKTAHELTTVAIWKTIFVRQLTIFMADFFSSLDSFARYTRSLARFCGITKTVITLVA